VAVFGRLSLQLLDAFLQVVNRQQRLLHSFAQGLIHLSESFQFFIVAQTRTVANLGPARNFGTPY
jgi:hypothetical protein